MSERIFEWRIAMADAAVPVPTSLHLLVFYPEAVVRDCAWFDVPAPRIKVARGANGLVWIKVEPPPFGPVEDVHVNGAVAKGGGKDLMANLVWEK
jgi:hypothetical protein